MRHEVGKHRQKSVNIGKSRCNHGSKTRLVSRLQQKVKIFLNDLSQTHTNNIISTFWYLHDKNWCILLKGIYILYISWSPSILNQCKQHLKWYFVCPVVGVGGWVRGRGGEGPFRGTQILPDGNTVEYKSDINGEPLRRIVSLQKKLLTNYFSKENVKI